MIRLAFWRRTANDACESCTRGRGSVHLKSMLCTAATTIQATTRKLQLPLRNARRVFVECHIACGAGAADVSLGSDALAQLPEDPVQRPQHIRRLPLDTRMVGVRFQRDVGPLVGWVGRVFYGIPAHGGYPGLASIPWDTALESSLLGLAWHYRQMRNLGGRCSKKRRIARRSRRTQRECPG